MNHREFHEGGSNSNGEHSIRPEGATQREPAESIFRLPLAGAEAVYLKEGQPLTWLEVQSLVGEIMKERGITYSSTSDLQRKLPAWIFSLQQEVDTLKAEKPPKKK